MARPRITDASAGHSLASERVPSNSPHIAPDIYDANSYYPFFLRDRRHAYFAHPVGAAAQRLGDGWSGPLRANPATHMRVTTLLHHLSADQPILFAGKGGKTYSENQYDYQ
jgi:hypothetical protein